MSEATDDLIAKAQQQLDEHKKWLHDELMKLGAADEPRQDPKWVILVHQASQIKLRVAKVSGRVASVVYEYPDELVAFLRAETTPKHLRDSLAGGHVVDPSQRTFTAMRTDGEP